MVKLKQKSKRLSTHQRTKIERKVREHHRKIRKEAKKNQNTGSNISKSRKDPGIPKNFPGREEFIAKAKADYEQEQAHKQQQRTEAEKLKALLADATEKSSKFESQSSTATAVTSVSDNSKKAFFKDFKQVVEASDVILQVLDARDPIGTRVHELEKLVLEQTSGKRIVLVLNKVDLVPQEVREGWLKALRLQLPCIPFKASTQSQKQHLGQVESAKAIGKTSECVGAQSLLQLLKNYCRNLNIKTSITVGVVGYPNVGKSSIINSLKRARVCKVSGTPGVTTCLQQIQLDRNIKLIDSPGIVFSNQLGNSLALHNCIRVEQMEDPVEAFNFIYSQVPVQTLSKALDITNEECFDSPNAFLKVIAQRRGKLGKGGIPDVVSAARAVLLDWNAGKIPFFREPPVNVEPASASFAIVSSWAPEFNLDQVYNSSSNSSIMEEIE